MVEIKDKNLDERSKSFIPTQINAVIICESIYDFMTDANLCYQAAEQLQDHQAKNEC